MAIIHEPGLFAWDQVDAASDLDRLRRVLEALPDEALMLALEAERKGKRDEYPLRGVWNSLVAGIVFQHPGVESLRRELLRNAELRQVCGFDPLVGLKAVPPPWVYTRLFRKLIAHQADVDAMLDALVERLRVLLTDLGTHLAVDSKGVDSHGKPTEKTEPDGRRDTEADWGTKTYTGTREDGTVWEKIKRWFGYRHAFPKGVGSSRNLATVLCEAFRRVRLTAETYARILCEPIQIRFEHRPPKTALAGQLYVPTPALDSS